MVIKNYTSIKGTGSKKGIPWVDKRGLHAEQMGVGV